MELFGRVMLDDPYAAYSELRQRDPVHWSEQLGVWVLTRYDDVRTVLLDPAFSSKIADAADGPGGAAADVRNATYSFVHSSLVFSDPPEHTRLRRLVSRAFTPSTIERLADVIGVLSDRLIDGAGPQPDLVHDLAEPLPIAVLGELLGITISVEEGRRLKTWCDNFLLPFGRNIHSLSTDELERARAAGAGLSEFVSIVLERHRPAGKGDVIDRLVAGEADDRLTLQELFANIVLLLIAGHENTTSLIANGAAWLLDLPEVRDMLLRDPTRWPAVMSELLRLITPNQFIRRQATKDCAIGKCALRAGDAVLLVLASANRDPEQFPEPDSFVLDRPQRGDVALGHGFHYCLGAPLAQLESRIALHTIFDHYPNLTRTGDPLTYADNFNVRMLRALPVRT